MMYPSQILPILEITLKIQILFTQHIGVLMSILINL